MKITRLFAVCMLALCFSIPTLAVEDNKPLSPTKQLRKEVARLIDNPELSKHGIKEAEVLINFTVDENNQLILLKVVTDNPYLEAFVRDRLNYQEIDVSGLQSFLRYNVTVNFESEKK